MFRYFKLYFYFLRFSFSRAMEFRFEFWFRILMDTFFYFIQISFFKILYLHTDTLVGWNENEALVFIATFLVVDAIQMTLISNNMFQFPFLVNQGTLDYYLVRPVSTLFFVSLREFAANSFVNLFMAIGILVWALLNYSGHFTGLTLACFLFAILVGTFIYYCIRMILLVPVMWTHSNVTGSNIFFALVELAQRPDRIYTGLMRKFCLFVMPFALMASVPARILFEGPSVELLLHVILAAIGIFFALLLFWKVALRSYSSASS